MGLLRRQAILPRLLLLLVALILAGDSRALRRKQPPPQYSQALAEALRRTSSRRIIRPADIEPQNASGNRTFPASEACVAKSPCGLWVEALEPTVVCRDLCSDTQFLPAFLPTAEATGRLREDAALFHRRLQATLGRPPATGNRGLCASPPQPIGSPKAGLGIVLQYAAHWLVLSAATGAVYTPPRSSLATWTTEGLCGARRSINCFFSRWTHCQPPKLIKDTKGLASEDWELPAELEAEALGIGKSGLRSDVALPGFERHGSLWSLAQGLAHIWSPRPWLGAAIQAAAAQLPDEARLRPRLGIHVRRGDSCAAGRQCLPWARFREAALRMVALYAARSVLLASDDPEVAEACVADPALRCSVTSYNRSALSPTKEMTAGLGATRKKSSIYVENRIMSGELDGGVLAEAALVDLSLLGDCDMFLGTFSSSFSRIAFLLMTARKGRPVPFVSLDTALAHPDGRII